MKGIKNFLKIITKLNRILDNRQKKRLLLAFGAGLLGSFLELLGVGVILPFIQALMAPDTLRNNEYIQLAIKLFNIQDDYGLILFLGIVMAVVFILKNAVLIGISYIQNYYSTGIQKELSLRLLDTFLLKDYEYYLNPNRPSLVTSCVSDVNSTYLAIMSILGVVQETISIAFLATFLLVTDVFTAVSALIVTFIVMIVSICGLRPIIKMAGKKSREADDAKHRQMNKISGGIKEIYVTRSQEFFRARFERISEKTRETAMMFSFWGSVPDRAVEGICVSGLIFIICLKFKLSPEGIATFIPKLAAFAMAAFKILPSVGKIVSRMNAVMFYNPGIDSLYSNLIEGGIDNTALSEEEKTYSDTKPISFKKTTVNDLSFAYKNSDVFVLQDISLDIHSGKTIAFIGLSGAGKTTLIDCIIGLLKPSKGRIMVDDYDISGRRAEWAKTIGYVPQNVFLMEDTLRNNILFGECDKGDEAIWGALRRAQIESFVENLPDGLNSQIGESGVNLSGGQRQRIAIARALYREPHLLILDEATSALDNATEEAVMSAIDALHGELTIIIIAHRLSTIKNADQIYEVVNGKLAERKIEDILVD